MWDYRWLLGSWSLSGSLCPPKMSTVEHERQIHTASRNTNWAYLALLLSFSITEAKAETQGRETCHLATCNSCSLSLGAEQFTEQQGGGNPSLGMPPSLPRLGIFCRLLCFVLPCPGAYKQVKEGWSLYGVLLLYTSCLLFEKCCKTSQGVYD